MIESIKSLFRKNSGASSIIINGVSYSGESVTINNDKIIIDGKPVDMPDGKKIEVTVQGDLRSLQLTNGIVNAQGLIGDIGMQNGTVNAAADIKGGISLGNGKVICNDVYADVNVDMGSIKASTIHGSASTKMGNISR
jgi:hypothetical protein